MDKLMEQFRVFMNLNRKKEISENTFAAYKSDIKQFFKFIDEDIKNINSNKLEEYKTHLLVEKNPKTGKRLSVKSVNRKILSVNAFVKFLNEKNLANISKSISMLDQQRQSFLDDVISKNDVERILRAVEREEDKRAKAIVYTLYLTGMRVSEMLTLRIDDVDKDILSVSGKGDKHRDIIISKKLKEVWEEYLPVRIDKGDALFTGQKGAINRITVNKILKYYAGQARVKLSKVHAHAFRHLFCLQLAKKGVSIDTIADLAGHESLDTTRIYTRLTKKELRNVLDDLL